MATEGDGSAGLWRTMVIVPETIAMPSEPIVAQVAVLVTPTLMVLPLVGLTCVPLQKSISESGAPAAASTSLAAIAPFQVRGSYV